MKIEINLSEDQITILKNHISHEYEKLEYKKEQDSRRLYYCNSNDKYYYKEEIEYTEAKLLAFKTLLNQLSNNNNIIVDRFGDRDGIFEYPPRDREERDSYFCIDDEDES